ncbi:transglutaminase domain-containing protein [Saccharopolyspora sp. NPDC000359]|uniref:transglutaminase domain-containing protein n=1 Tax=Saccharopolyspora sp. NPDC000359 TaxID=3154251 RepID=UPI0033293156
MTTPQECAHHSRYTDPGRYAPLLDALPTDIRQLAAVTGGLVVHYRGAGIAFTGERLAEVDSRWTERLLATDQRRFPVPLTAPRPLEQRLVGCCRDATLLTVAALRQHGIPARSRVGFAAYFHEGFHADHVIAEFWDGQRWVLADAQLDQADHPFNTCDIPRDADLASAPFATAAQVWTAHRRGEVDVDRFGVGPDHPMRGHWFAANYVLRELAHRRRDELLLWDFWGALVTTDSAVDVDLVDEIAALLLAADGGDEAAERELADRYSADPRLHPGERVHCQSPSGVDALVELT